MNWSKQKKSYIQMKTETKLGLFQAFSYTVTAELDS